MAWIESHQSLGTHRKLYALTDMLHIDEARAVGMLHYLWWWALDNAPDGDITGIQDKVIAKASHWRGPPSDWVNALASCGWIDSADGRQLHAWSDYAGKLIDRRIANTERMRIKRATNVQRTCSACAPATVPNPTVPNHIPPIIPPKKTYGEFSNVLLTDEQYQKLFEQFTEAGTKERIEHLSTGIASKGYKYKNHYATILSWERRNGGINGTSGGHHKASPNTKYEPPEQVFARHGR